jgi:hypothetical protein
MALQGIEHNYRQDSRATSITSLVLRGRTLWAGLTAGPKALVPFDPASRTFGQAVDIFPWADTLPQIVQKKIHNGLGLLDDGRLAIGEGILFNWDGIPFDMRSDRGLAVCNRRRAQLGLGPLPLEVMQPVDMETFDMRWMEGGKILTYAPETGAVETIGRLTPFEYAQSITVDPARHRGYGHTIGGCHFFVADFDAKTVEDHGTISRFAFHNLAIAPDGVVYGAWIDSGCADKLRVLRYDPDKGYLERLSAAYLDDPGQACQGNVGLDQWLVHSSGRMFVGIAGTGTLYEFDREALSLRRIGTAGPGGRVTTLDEDEHGRVLFTGGYPIMHVGRYDPATGKLEDLGPITDKYDHIYFHGSVYIDGTLYLAETDAGIATLWEVPLPE